MISLIIKDGLGNQLFQYAYTRYLQHLYREQGIDEEIVINPYYIDRYDFRKVALQNFVLNDSVHFLENEKQRSNMNLFKVRTLMANGFDVIQWKLLKKKKPLGEQKFQKRGKRGVYYTYTSQTEYETVLSKKKNKFVFGCYQGEKNFAPIADIIRKELEIKTMPSDSNKEMLEKINSTEAVCLHIRRGDYLDPKWKSLQVCTFEYYNRAINEMLRRVENPTFFVFSNSHEDIEWIKANYMFVNEVDGTPIRLIYVDLGNPDYEELRLMKSCKHFIISNSTFSWWAAYLSSGNQKNVMVPERWNLSIENDTVIYLDNWVRVQTN